MKVFLTGGAGYIGSHIATELLLAGHDVTILSRNDHASDSYARLGAKYVRGDLADVAEFGGWLRGVDAVIHNAIIWPVEPLERELRDSVAAIRLFESAATAGVQSAILTSSVAVHRPFSIHMDETSPVHPTDYYSATKAAAEMFLSAISYQTEMRCNTVRLGPVVGRPAFPGAPFRAGQRFEEMARDALLGKCIQIDGEKARQFISARDAARLFCQLLESTDNRQTVIGVSREAHAWVDIAKTIVDRIGSSSTVVEGPGLSQSHFDPAKMERLTGKVFDATEAMSEHIECLVTKFGCIYGRNSKT